MRCILFGWNQKRVNNACFGFLPFLKIALGQTGLEGLWLLQVGAVAIKQSVYAMPFSDAEEFRLFEILYAYFQRHRGEYTTGRQ